jgi:hypothetical protein
MKPLDKLEIPDYINNNLESRSLLSDSNQKEKVIRGKIKITSFVLSILFLAIITADLCAFDLQTTPDYYWDNQNFGNGLCVEQLTADNCLDIIGSYNQGGALYMTNQGTYSYCHFDQANASYIQFNANSVQSGCLRGTDESVWPPVYFPNDVVMARNQDIKIYTNNRNGSLVPSSITITPLQSPNTANWVGLGSVSADGFTDIVTAPYISGEISGNILFVYRSWFNTISGTPTSTLPRDGAGRLILAPLNAWGSDHDEIAVATQEYVTVYKNIIPPPYYDWWLALEIDDDGDPVVDLVTGNVDPLYLGNQQIDIIGCSENQITVYQNRGIGNGFLPLGDPIYGENIQQIALGEYNYDGYTDLLVATKTRMVMYVNDGGGHFDIGQNPPVWEYNDLEADFGPNCQINEVLFADLRGLGALSLIFTARGTHNGHPVGAIGVFKDVTDPRVGPARNFEAFSSLQGNHPQLSWRPNIEFDISHYNVYRALMPDTSRPTQNDFSLLATINHPDSGYIDTSVTIHTPYDNVPRLVCS